MRIHRSAPRLALASLSTLFAVLAIGAAGQDGAVPRATGPASEPPQEARVKIGDETIDVTLGAPARTADGRELLVELLPTRTFDVPGAFRFAYPRDWRFLGAVGAAGVADAWWTISGDGATIHLRRHDLDAQEILETYVSNVESIGGETRRPATLELDGLTLSGFAIELDVGGMHGTNRRWVQEVYAWTGLDGSWMISVQRDITPPDPLVLAPTITTYVIVGDPDAAPTPTPDESATAPPTELEQLLTSFRWE